jgi:hypothetical protein
MRRANKERRNAGSPLPDFLVSFFPDSKNLCKAEWRERSRWEADLSVICASPVVKIRTHPILGRGVRAVKLP